MIERSPKRQNGIWLVEYNSSTKKLPNVNVVHHMIFNYITLLMSLIIRWHTDQDNKIKDSGEAYDIK